MGTVALLLAKGKGRAEPRSPPWATGKGGSILLMVSAHRSVWICRAHLILDFPPDFLQGLLL